MVGRLGARLTHRQLAVWLVEGSGWGVVGLGQRGPSGGTLEVSLLEAARTRPLCDTSLTRPWPGSEVSLLESCTSEWREWVALHSLGSSASSSSASSASSSSQLKGPSPGLCEALLLRAEGQCPELSPTPLPRALQQALLLRSAPEGRAPAPPRGGGASVTVAAVGRAGRWIASESHVNAWAPRRRGGGGPSG